MMRSNLLSYVLLPCVLFAFSACNQTPVKDLESSFSFMVQKDTEDDDPIKIDFLWVVDDSTSMCEEQASLARSFTDFQEALEEAFDIDVRIAAITVDAECEPGETTARGVFNNMPYKRASVDCAASLRVECDASAGAAATSCGNLDDQFGPPNEDARWRCSSLVSQTDPSCLVNPNDTYNTRCTRLCEEDSDCQEVFGEGYVCLRRGDQTGCAPVPPVDSCASVFDDYVARGETPPSVITNENIDLFPCIASVGLTPPSRCYAYEQTFKSTLLALDKNGVNAEQAKNFLRDDAYLVIVMISDEEDCSTVDGVSLSETNHDDCGLLKSADEGGPLLPVSHVANTLKALKKDPGRVIVAAIAGDSTEVDPAAILADRQNYIESKGAAKTCHAQSYICSSINGVADYGARFRQLTDSFGPNGIFTNICDDAGIGPALVRIADTIVSVINKVCLPRMVLDHLEVIRVFNGEETVLTEGEGPGTYRVLGLADDCAVDGRPMPAISFGDAPKPGEYIKISYQGDPQLD